MSFWLPSLDGRKLGYKELAEKIIEAIRVGHLPPDSLLPPSRALSDHAGVSRDTVLQCYRYLQSQGYAESNSTRGTFVSSNVLLRAQESGPAEILDWRLSDYGRSMTGNSRLHSNTPELLAFNHGAVPREYLPLRKWRKAALNRFEPITFRSLDGEMQPMGRQELREAVAAYLARTKGLVCKPGNVCIFDISFSAIALLSRLLLNPGDAIAVEEPGFGVPKNVANYLGLDLVPVPVDESGLMVSSVAMSKRKIKLVYVTPAHQEPTGRTMTLERRKELLSWAKKNDCWIIEDDYDGFLNYGVQTPPNLKYLDTDDNVIYLSTFWQLLYPISTICFVVVPDWLTTILERSKNQVKGLTDTMSQLVLADILNDGYFQMHTRKVERALALKRRAVYFELKKSLGSVVRIEKQTGGVTCLLSFDGIEEALVLQAAESSGLPLLSTAPQYVGEQKPGEFIAYFAGLSSDQSEICKTVTAFAKLLHKR